VSLSNQTTPGETDALDPRLLNEGTADVGEWARNGHDAMSDLSAQGDAKRTLTSLEYPR
jgi:hypothetical protein